MFDKQGEHAEPSVNIPKSFAAQLHECFSVNLQVSFGKGDQFWTNVFPTKLVERHQNEIQRFKFAMKFIRWFEVLFALIPIKITLRMFFFSTEFINYMIYPSLALFLGKLIK